MRRRNVSGRPILIALAWIALSPAVMVDEPEMAPYSIDWSRADESVVDMSGYLDAPAGENGFIRVKGKHLMRPDGSRFRIWGVNVGALRAFPPKDQAAAIADDMARCGVNVVRLHSIDSRWSPLFDRSRDDTQVLEAEALDRLDFFIAQLTERGIYANLNLNVSRPWKAGDGVRDGNLLGYGKSATYFNRRLIELQKDFARKLLTHRNPYTGNEYRHEPAVVTVELVNENSVLEGWVKGRLVGEDVDNPSTWTPIPVSYAEELTDQYNAWLQENVPDDELAQIRAEAGDDRVPRLRPDEFDEASALRFHTEARFYIHLEQTFFQDMRQLLKKELGVRPLVVGTADHSDSYCGYAHVRNNAILDFIDGHGYWQHPAKNPFRIRNTPMVNDPRDSTVVQFARTPMVGRPFTISETNHPYPAEWASEGIPILTAYALFHDWDGIYWFAWGPGRLVDREQTFRRSFDFENDPVKLTNLAACAAMWHRKDLEAAEQCIVRVYDEEQMIEGLRMPRSERPFFDPEFSRSTPLMHATRWTAEGDATAYPEAAPLGRIEADTGQLGWYGADEQRGQVVVDSPHTQALIGFFGEDSRSTTNVTATLLDTPFASVILTSFDGRPIAKSERLLLATTATSAHTGFQWNEDRKTVKQWGTFPTVIEPVRGEIVLKGLKDIDAVSYQPLTAEGRPLGDPRTAEVRDGRAKLTLGKPPATWYVLTARHREL